jgi:hypothetical protein
VEDTQIILWTIGGGFALNLTLMKIMFSHFDKRFDKMDEKITDIDRRLCRIEGTMAAKECCVLKNDRQERKVE